MTALYIEHDGWNILTNSWSAGAKANKTEETELCYAWSTYAGTGLTDNSTGVERLTLKIPLSILFRYVADCKRKAEVADLTPANLPRIISAYSRNNRR